MKILVREYRDADWDEVTRMTVSIVDLMSQIDSHKRFRPKEKFDAAQYAKLSMENAFRHQGKTFIAEADGAVAGYGIGFIVESDERDGLNKFPAKQGFIDAFFIKEEFRGRSVAEKLMASIEDYFRSIGCEFSSVASVAANEAARKFYGKMGYGEQYIDFLKKL
ncbi:MAG TPA: GNAT family N-acetyltransferase [Candidatus Peribacterales bacterium]|nr:GNAT family N-acetyltransferase [Candidatus Peribacterales bacterium]